MARRLVSADGMVSLFGKDPATYVAHPLHTGGQAYRETNCYADILIELLHARGDEPLAAMGINLRLDFEGDQWTFFKPAPGDLEALYGLDIHEMQPYRPLPEQIAEQLAAGRTIIAELDAWWLPDTAASSYRREHVKTSVAAEAIDVEGRRLRYFHNAGLHELAGEDFARIFRLGSAPLGAGDATSVADAVLPPYCELVRFDAGPQLRGADLKAAARAATRHHLARRPVDNPFARFGPALAARLPDLLAGDAALYHDYAFATVRMVGAGFELAAAHVDWLLGAEGAAASEAFGRIVSGSQVLSLRLARRRVFDPEPIVAGLAEAWAEAMDALDGALA